jgi:hypothetical protein
MLRHRPHEKHFFEKEEEEEEEDGWNVQAVVMYRVGEGKVCNNIQGLSNLCAPEGHKRPG